MNRKEALSFLELLENSSDQQIRKRLEEKISQFEELSNNSPSAFLRRLNSQHLSKLIVLQKDVLILLQKPVSIKPVKEEIDSKDNVMNDEISSLTMPVILPAALKGSFKKEVIEEPKPVAFLVRHTEDKSIKPFPLFKGRNYFGRKQHPTLAPFLALEEDEFVSRVHAVLFSDGNGANDFYIEDSADSNEGKPSKNGTYINGNKERINGKVKLKEKDTIQIGETKLIFCMNTRQLDKIIEEIEEKDYMHTVVVRL